VRRIKESKVGTESSKVAGSCFFSISGSTHYLIKPCDLPLRPGNRTLVVERFHGHERGQAGGGAHLVVVVGGVVVLGLDQEPGTIRQVRSRTKHQRKAIGTMARTYPFLPYFCFGGPMTFLHSGTPKVDWWKGWIDRWCC
jgi:hypothetical protein